MPEVICILKNCALDQFTNSPRVHVLPNAPHGNEYVFKRHASGHLVALPDVELHAGRNVVILMVRDAIKVAKPDVLAVPTQRVNRTSLEVDKRGLEHGRVMKNLEIDVASVEMAFHGFMGVGE